MAYRNIVQQLILYVYAIAKKIKMKKIFALSVYTIFF